MEDTPLNPRFKVAYERFEEQLPLLKLLVARVMPSNPSGPNTLVIAAANALWKLAVSFEPHEGASFSEAAEVTINSELLSRMHFTLQSEPVLAKELAPYEERLQALEKVLAAQVPQLGVMPYYGGLVRQPGALTSYDEFVSPVPVHSSEGKLLHALSEIVRRRWPLILSVVLLTEVCVGVISMREPKVYKATTTINTGIASGQSISGAQVDWFKAGALMGNLTEMLQSRTVLERTERKLSLALAPEKFAKLISVDKVGQTDIMKISATAKTPALAAQLANTLTSEFIAFYQQSQGADARHTNDFIANQLAISGAALQQAEDKLRAFKEQNVPEAQTTLATQLADLKAKEGEVERTLMADKSGLAAVESELATLKHDPMFARTVADSPDVDKAGDRIKTLEQNLEDAKTLYGESSSVVHDLHAQIAKAEGSLKATSAKVAAGDPANADILARRIALKVDIAQEQAKLASLNRAIADLEPKARTASVADVTYKQLQNEVTIREAEYQKMQERAGNARLDASGGSMLPIAIVDPAVPPIKPEDAKTSVKLALGGLIALILGFVLAYVLEVRERGRREAHMVEARLDGEHAA